MFVFASFICSDIPQTLQLSKPTKMKSFSSIEPPHCFHFAPFFSSTSIRFCIRTPIPFSARVFFCQAKSGTNESFNIKVLPPTLLADPHIVYLMEHGMNSDQIRTLMRRSPAFARYSLEDKIKPLVEFFLELGVPKEQIPIILTKRPQLCALSLSKNIKPTVKFLESLGADKKQWVKAIYRFPTLLTYSKQKINEKVDFLLELGISDESIGRILTRFPNIVGCSVEDNLRPTATYFRSLGVDVGALLLRCPQMIGLSIEANIKPATEFFLERGYTLEEIGTMISRCAMLYTYSLTETMVPKLDFFMTTDYPKSELVNFPQYFGYSLEQRIKPRYARMKASGVRVVLNRLLSVTSSDFEEILLKKLKKLQVE
ncbi:transcription termination factor MTERF5, chloroplastic-like isoform X1 [Trifolium pratense]|uniref:transcription termination factor MTERF5, chloroplastic-like isoform X1 n=1 Tax=Trifolium pratense TaxID=57577 RepID=UPI001E68FDA4|nr:transcription termination factor MTERF5, chloroplastic-like isoform X1 [Trifolium pratense]